MSTPEGKVKAAVNKLLAQYKLYKFMPVPSGYGMSSLDYLVCVNGVFVGIETKAPGKKPTPRQEVMIENIKDAGGVVFVVDGVDSKGMSELRVFLDECFDTFGL